MNVQAERVLELLQTPQSITPEDVAALHTLVAQYPYFQAAYVLLAKEAYDHARPDVTRYVQQAAVHATNRRYLKAFLEGTDPFAAPPLASSLTSISSAPKSTTTPDGDIKSLPNDYLQAIQQKNQRPITKQRNRAQLDKIQAFLQKGIHYKPPTLPESSETFQMDLTQRNTSLRDDLVTETLARILWQQGKQQRALEMYKQLMRRFPKQKKYFLTIIEKLSQQV